MNEIRTAPVPQVKSVVISAASPAKLDEAATLSSGGKVLPAEKDKPVSDVEASNIEQVVTEINKYVQSVQRDLHFSVDEDSGLTIVRVRDKESGELIRQIPEDIFLNLAQDLIDNQSIHFFDAQG